MDHFLCRCVVSFPFTRKDDSFYQKVHCLVFTLLGPIFFSDQFQPGRLEAKGRLASGGGG
jgi:hypothetical protein